jgi:hypothetical protein
MRRKPRTTGQRQTQPADIAKEWSVCSHGSGLGEETSSVPAHCRTNGWVLHIPDSGNEGERWILPWEAGRCRHSGSCRREARLQKPRVHKHQRCPLDEYTVWRPTHYVRPKSKSPDLNLFDRRLCAKSISGECRLEVDMHPDGFDQHRAAVLVVARVIDVLQVERVIDSAPRMQVVIALENVFPGVV